MNDERTFCNKVVSYNNIFPDFTECWFIYILHKVLQNIFFIIYDLFI